MMTEGVDSKKTVKVLVCEVHHLAWLVSPLRLLGFLLGLGLGVGQEGFDGRLGVVHRVDELEGPLGDVEEGGEAGHVVLPGHAGVLWLVQVHGGGVLVPGQVPRGVLWEGHQRLHGNGAVIVLVELAVLVVLPHVAVCGHLQEQTLPISNSYL